jgi:hypothetical protein
MILIEDNIKKKEMENRNELKKKTLNRENV